MHEIIPNTLWIGHAGDLSKPAALELAGVKAVIQVALAEQMPALSRDMLLAHFPIVDGAGNPRGIIAAALETTAALIRHAVPTLVCCSGGMSRSPCIAAGALAMTKGVDPNEALQRIIRDQPHDVSSGLWAAVCAIVHARRS